MSAVYEKAGEAFLTRKIDWRGDDIRAVLVTKDYTPNVKKDEFLSDIPAKARVAFSGLLEKKAVSGFTCKAASLLMERVIGPECNAVVLFQAAKGEKDSRIITYIDTASFLPFAPNGGDLEIGWGEDGSIFDL